MTRAISTLSLLGVVVLSTALSLTSACDSGPKQGEEALYYGKKLHEGELKNREAAMAKLAELKDKRSLPDLYEVLKGPAASLRPDAVSLITQIGDETSIDPLIGAVDWSAGAGSDKTSRANANTNEKIAKALSAIGKGDNPKVVDTLKRLSADNNLDVQLAAVFGLGELGAKDAVPELIEIADGHPHNFVVKNAAEALGKIADPRAVPVLTKLLFFERTGVSFYREASYALFQIGKEARPALLEVWDNKFKPIEELHVEPNLQRTKALVVLADLADPADFDRIAAAVDTPGNDTATSLLRIEAQRAAGRLGLQKVTKSLLNRWDNVDISQSEHALAALTQLGRKEVAPQLLSFAASEGFMKQCADQGGTEQQCRTSEAQIRKPRLLALARLSDDVAIFEKLVADEKNDGLKKWIEEQKPRVDAAAACKGKGVPCWVEKSKDANAKVRERAAYELMFANTDEARDALLPVLDDEDNEARYAAIIGVGRRLPKDVAVADTIDKQLADEKGKTQFIRVNEDLKRLEIRVRRGY